MPGSADRASENRPSDDGRIEGEEQIRRVIDVSRRTAGLHRRPANVDRVYKDPTQYALIKRRAAHAALGGNAGRQ
jgi:hypothetical protein